MSDTTEIERLVEYAEADRVVHFADYLSEKSNRPKKRSFPTGFELFDKKLGPIETGRVIVISGYAKNGKTLFTESVIKGIMDNDPLAKAVFFSFEIDAESMMEKYRVMPDRGIFLPLELRTMDPDWLVARCKEARFKHNCRIVLLDHLHYLVDMNTKQNMSLNIGAFMRRLKVDIAKALDMVVFLNAHQEKGKEDQEASMRGARDSSFIGQECDAFVVVTRRKNFTAKDYSEIEERRGKYHAETLKAALEAEMVNGAWDDEASQGLAIVKVDCSRMSGSFGSRTLFRKQGDFLVEV